jgi:hypothetical protein
MYVEPFDDWHKLEENFDITRLNFTWNCSRYERDKYGQYTTLYIDLVFNSPNDVSPFAD